MPPRAVPRGSIDQASVFYTDVWSKDFDDLFILGLCEQTGLGNHCAHGRPNRTAISYAKDRVNGHNGTHFNYKFFLDRFHRLYKRYTIFRYIIDQPGVEHNERTHSVTAEESVWNRICRVHALAYAYMRQGEGNFGALEFIFTAMPNIPAGNEVEIIEISSDHDTISADTAIDGVFDNELAWYNSVNSQSTDGASTNINDTGASGVHSDTVCIGRSDRRRSIHRIPPISGPSSQASSSPFKPDY